MSIAPLEVGTGREVPSWWIPPLEVVPGFDVGNPKSTWILLSASRSSVCCPTTRLFLGCSVRISRSCDRTTATVSNACMAGTSQLVGKNSTVLLIWVARVLGM